MVISFLGDTHSLRPELTNLKYPTFQIGDFGVGFCQERPLDSKLKFIRGNHDDPVKSRNHPNYLGDYGYLTEQSLFYISGAASLERATAVEGIEWWSEEELSMPKAAKALELYEMHKPRIVISHDAPLSWISQIVQSSQVDTNLTRQLLQSMVELHQPELWVFGHHHKQFSANIGSTQVLCLDIREQVTFEILPSVVKKLSSIYLEPDLSTVAYSHERVEVDI